MVETEILDAAAHPCLKTHNIPEAGPASVFRSDGQKERGPVLAGLFKELVSIPGHDSHAPAYSNQPVRHGVGPLLSPIARNEAREHIFCSKHQTSPARGN
jgi:hypothetical protein